MWICKLIGHKHVRSSGGYLYFNPEFCLRCHATALTKKGDGAIICEILGHHSKTTLVGDFDSTEYHAQFCFRCHAAV